MRIRKIERSKKVDFIVNLIGEVFVSGMFLFLLMLLLTIFGSK